MSAESDLIAGVHAVLAVLAQTPERVDVVWVDDQRRDRRVAQVIALAHAARVKVHRVPRAKLDALLPQIPHQGVAARALASARRGGTELEAALAELATPFLLVLDGVQDPHNLGACLRIADAAGVHGVIIPRANAVSVTATARKVASGAAETVPVYEVSNLARALDTLKARGVWLVGASGEAEASLFDADLRGPLALVLGGEERGLRRLTRERCDTLVRIPMLGRVESLNVAAAAAVCAFEALRQRAPGRIA